MKRCKTSITTDESVSSGSRDATSSDFASTLNSKATVLCLASRLNFKALTRRADFVRQEQPSDLSAVSQEEKCCTALSAFVGIPLLVCLEGLLLRLREASSNSIDSLPREARDLISKIRSCTVRSDLKNKAFSAVFCLFLRSDLTVQDRILEIRSLASLSRLLRAST